MLMRWVSIAVALLAWHLWNHKHAIQAQLFRKNLPSLFSADRKCELIQEKVDNQFKFCEDGLVYAPGIAIFSCDPGRHEWNTVMVRPNDQADPRGKPYRLELTNFPTDADFHPLGIEITPTEPTGTPRLLVVNHKRQNSTIEVFHIQRGLEFGTVTLEYEMTLIDPSFVAPNAIAAISPNAFVLSHDHYFTRRMVWPFNMILPPLETFLALPLGKVDLITFEPFKGVSQVQNVAHNIPFANGVAVSNDRSTLAIASTTRAEVLFYSLYANGEMDIKFVSSVQIPFSVDNIAFAGDTLLAAGHPHLPEFMALVKRKSNRAPSYVVEIAPQTRKEWADDGTPRETWLAQIVGPDGASVNAAFISDGSFLSTSSGAFMDLDIGAMFVVALYGSGVAKCSHV
ncbi:hypothetical protein B0J17DRAFT_646563 [Rhizoctonia solani]|nr:hypothetical protein B0J17DRAFT_646563 [Rhizoctonia solani]